MRVVVQASWFCGAYLMFFVNCFNRRDCCELILQEYLGLHERIVLMYIWVCAEDVSIPRWGGGGNKAAATLFEIRCHRRLLQHPQWFSSLCCFSVLLSSQVILGRHLLCNLPHRTKCEHIFDIQLDFFDLGTAETLQDC